MKLSVLISLIWSHSLCIINFYYYLFMVEIFKKSVSISILE